MNISQITAAEAIGDGMAFTRWAWRRAGLVQLAAAAGLAMLFVSLRGPLQPGPARLLLHMGLVVSLVAWAPLWTALHRLALGGAAARKVRFGGLQFDRTALRFLGLGAIAGLAVMLSMSSLVAISAGVFLLFHGLGAINLGPLGPIQVSFLVAASAWMAGLAGLGYAAVRLAFCPAATISRRRLAILETWPLTDGYAKAVVGSWLLAQGPILLCLALLALTDPLELQGALGAAGRWPMPDVLVAGAVLGLIAAFIQAPLTAGVLGGLYRHRRALRAHVAVRMPGPRRASTASAPRTPDWEPLVFQRAISRPLQRLDQGV